MIQFSSRRNMRYLFFLLACHYTRKIEGMIMSKVIHFSDSLTLMILMFFGEFLGGLVVFLYNHLYFERRKKLGGKNIGVKLIQGKAGMRKADGLFKTILLIFFAASFDFIEFTILHSIPDISIISPTSDQRLCIIITMISSFLCTFALKLKTGRHHNFSLLGMGICSIIIFIIELIYKSKGTVFGVFILAYFLALFRLIFISFTDIIEKYLVEYNFVNKFVILSSEGFFGIILCTIYSFGESKNPINIMNNVYKELDTGKKVLMIIFLFLYFILSAGINLYKIICNIIYTPMVKSLPAYFLNPLFIIYYFVYEGDFKSEGKRNYFYFIINVILSIIIDFFALIYNEFFILNCYDLQKDTHYVITKRAVKNSAMEMEEFENIDNDASFASKG